MKELGNFDEVLSNLFASVELWFDALGMPLTDEQRQAIADAGIQSSESPLHQVKLHDPSTAP